MDSRRCFRRMEKQGKTRLLLRRDRPEPRDVQHGPRYSLEAGPKGRAAKLLRLSLCRARWKALFRSQERIHISRRPYSPRASLKDFNYRLIIRQNAHKSLWTRRGVSAHASAQRRLIITISIQTFGVQELPRYVGRVTMLPVNLKIHLAHFLVRNLSSQSSNRRAHLRMQCLRLAANNGHSLIGWKVVLIVCEDHKVARRKQSICGISRY